LPDQEEFETSKLEVVALSPPPGTTLTRESVVRARIRFAMKRRANTRYALFPQFRTTDPKKTFDGSFPNDRYPAIDASAGTVEISFPISYVFDDAQLARPVQLKFLLTRYFSTTSSVMIAETKFFEYPVP
jgi:hypothetical protein